MSAYPANSAAVQQQQTQQQQQQQQQQRHQQRLNELLEAVKQEFDFALSEASLFKQVKEDYDLKYNQQTAEMQQIRQTVYELEMAHRKIKQAYEDEILRLKTELENRDRAAAAAAHQHQHQHQHQQQHQQPNGAPYGSYPPQPQQPRPAGAAGALPPPIRQSPPIEAPKVEPPKENGAPVPGPATLPPVTQAVGEAQAQAQAQATSAQAPAQAAPAEPETSTALTIIDKSQYVVNPTQKALHVKEIPPFLQDLDMNKASPEFTKQHQDYFVLYNPAFERLLEIDLIHSLDHSSVVCCVRFSKNGEFIATGCNKTTQVFNVKTGELVAKLIDDNTTNSLNGEADANGAQNGESSSATDGNGSASSTTVAAPAPSTVNANGDLYIRSVCFSPDGKFLATGAEDKLIRIWDLATKRIIKILRGHEQDIYSLEFFPDGTRLVSGSGDRTVRIWDLRSSQCSLTLSIEDGVTTVAVSPDGQLIAAGSLDRTVRVWDSTTGFLVERLDSGNEHGNGHEDSVYSVVFSANGKQLVSGCLDRTVKLWNLEGKQDSNESTSNAVSNKKSSCEVTYTGHKDFVLSVCLTSKNEYIISGSKDRGVIFWDENSGNPLLMLQGHRNSVISVAVSSNSDATEGIFATGSGDCKARLWRWKKK